jgi:hypothetical protein
MHTKGCVEDYCIVCVVSLNNFTESVFCNTRNLAALDSNMLFLFWLADRQTGGTEGENDYGPGNFSG